MVCQLRVGPGGSLKCKKMAELKIMGDLMLSHIAVLEGEHSSPSGSSSPVRTLVNQRRVPWVVEQQCSRPSLALSSTQTQTTDEEAQIEASSTMVAIQRGQVWNLDQALHRRSQHLQVHSQCCREWHNQVRVPLHQALHNLQVFGRGVTGATQCRSLWPCLYKQQC